MKTELQDQLWAALPEEFKHERALEYDSAIHSCCMSPLYARARMMEDIFGVHNLKSGCGCNGWVCGGGGAQTASSHIPELPAVLSLSEEWCRNIIKTAYPAAAKFLESIREIEVMAGKPGFIAGCGMAFETFLGSKEAMENVIVKP